MCKEYTLLRTAVLKRRQQLGKHCVELCGTVWNALWLDSKTKDQAPWCSLGEPMFRYGLQ